MIELNTREIERLERDLKKFNDVAYPIAVQSATNQNAFDAMRAAKSEIVDSMTLRNKFTESGFGVDKSPRTRQIERIQAVMGTRRDYLEGQEFGRVERGTAIPTGDAAGQPGQKPRTRLPTRTRAMRNVRLTGSLSSSGNVARVKEARAEGRKFMYMRLKDGRRGMFRVFGTKKRPKVRMIADITRKPRVVPARPWMKPALAATRQKSRQNYVDALNYQAERADLFKN